MKPSTDMNNKEGSAILIALFFTLMATSVAGLFLSYSSYEANLTRRSIDQEKLRIAAEAALDYGLVQLKELVMDNQLTISRGTMQSLLDAQANPPARGDYVYQGPEGEDGFVLAVHSEPTSGVLPDGQCEGQEGVYQTFSIKAGARNPNTGGNVVLEQTLQAMSLPLIRFGVFYEDDLEMNPGPLMHMYGPVHCNADMYISPGNQLFFHDRVTSHGDMYRRRKDDTTSTGYVGIEDENNVEVAMTIDSTADDWMIVSLENWGGQVQSGAHGIQELRPPIAAIDEPHDIIERPLPTNDPNYRVETEAEKYANKACLVLRIHTNGTLEATDAFGSNVTARFTRAVLPTNGPLFGGMPMYVKTNGYYVMVSNGTYSVAQTNFYDHREGAYMRPVDIYVNELLRQFPELTGTTYTVAEGRSVVYITRDDPDGAGPRKPCVRIRHGKRLPGSGFSIASDVPVYIEGDFNVTNKTVTFVAGDAVTELSTAWQDARSRTGSLSDRKASNTTYNVVIFTGNNETTLGHYNGGLENVMRFLEDWTSKTVRFRGSIIDLWHSEIATGVWVYGSPRYEAPIRDFGYDDMYRTQIPPGMTSVFALEETSWGLGNW